MWAQAGTPDGAPGLREPDESDAGLSEIMARLPVILTACGQNPMCVGCSYTMWALGRVALS